MAFMSHQRSSVASPEVFNTAVRHFQQGQLREADKICRQILKADPQHADALHLQGVIAIGTGHYKEAARLLRQALRINPAAPFYHSNLGLAFQNQGLSDEALEAYNRALELNPGIAEAHMNSGNILRERGMFDEAEQRLRAALQINPSLASAHYNLGLVLQNKNQAQAAQGCYERALSLQPDLPGARVNLGVIYKDLGRYDDAVQQYQLALQITPDSAEAYNNLGIALNDMGRFEDAVKACRTALDLDPDNAEIHYNLGFALKGQKKIGEAIAAYETSLAMNADNPSAVCELVHRLQHVCDWEKAALWEEKLLQMVKAGRKGISPFVVLGTAAGPDEQLQAARQFGQQFIVPDDQMFKHQPPRDKGRIRVGYMSADYYQHATAYLMAELFERHDRARFEITAYSYSPDDKSALRARLEKGFDRFIDIRRLPHHAAAQKIYDDKIDILIDLKGYTGEGRVPIAAYRPAPVQVNYLGYPGTLGLPFFDYIIGDGFITPMEHQAFYSEKIVQLPQCYQPNDTHREIAMATPTRQACGLPDNAFVFCSFNSPYKITPAVFDVWMRLLKAVSGSVLWIFEGNTLVKGNLQRAAADRGVDPARLVFAPGLLLPEHLARHALADLFLDTMPINAHTTASDSLWAGLPLLTCAGNSFVSRVAGSLLKAAHLPQFIAADLADYEAKALHWAQHPDALKSVRRDLWNSRLTLPLFDIGRFVKDIESAYDTMWGTWQKGQVPQAFAVK